MRAKKLIWKKCSIKSIGDSYGYNVQEMRASRMAGKSLDARKGAAARRASDYMVNKIAFAGDKKHNLVGIFSDNTDIPLYTLSEVEDSKGAKHTEWAYKTADQILEDINGMQVVLELKEDRATMVERHIQNQKADFQIRQREEQKKLDDTIAENEKREREGVELQLRNSNLKTEYYQTVNKLANKGKIVSGYERNSR